MNCNDPVEAAKWDRLVKGLSKMMVEGIGLKCPFCGEIGVSRIESGILEVKCGTRIAIKPREGSTLNVVTQNGHSHGVGSTVDSRYPYTEFDCKA